MMFQLFLSFVLAQSLDMQTYQQNLLNDISLLNITFPIKNSIPYNIYQENYAIVIEQLTRTMVAKLKENQLNDTFFWSLNNVNDQILNERINFAVINTLNTSDDLLKENTNYLLYKVMNKLINMTDGYIEETVSYEYDYVYLNPVDNEVTIEQELIYGMRHMIAAYINGDLEGSFENELNQIDMLKQPSLLNRIDTLIIDSVSEVLGEIDSLDKLRKIPFRNLIGMITNKLMFKSSNLTVN